MFQSVPVNLLHIFYGKNHLGKFMDSNKTTATSEIKDSLITCHTTALQHSVFARCSYEKIVSNNRRSYDNPVKNLRKKYFICHCNSINTTLNASTATGNETDTTQDNCNFALIQGILSKT